MIKETVSQESESTPDNDLERRRRCIALEAELMSLGNYDGSLARAMRRVVEVGQYVGDEPPERALLRWAATTSKAIAIAVNRSGPGDTDEHDLVLWDHEAAIALAGMAEVLSVAPRLIAALDVESEAE